MTGIDRDVPLYGLRQDLLQNLDVVRVEWMVLPQVMREGLDKSYEARISVHGASERPKLKYTADPDMLIEEANSNIVPTPAYEGSPA